MVLRIRDRLLLRFIKSLVYYSVLSFTLQFPCQLFIPLFIVHTVFYYSYPSLRCNILVYCSFPWLLFNSRVYYSIPCVLFNSRVYYSIPCLLFNPLSTIQSLVYISSQIHAFSSHT